jgi:hypothetical protein
MDRPLPVQLLNYAAHDIYAIAALYEHFLAVKWIPKDISSLLKRCTRYVSIHLARGVPHLDDIYRRGPFLPLDIIMDPAGPLVQCKGCIRSLNPIHFEWDARKRRALAFCRVCEAMKVKVKNDAKKAEERAKKADAREERALAQAAARAEMKALGQSSTVAAQGGSDTCIQDVGSSGTEHNGVPCGLVAAFDAMAVTTATPEELAYLAPLIDFMRQKRKPHFLRETMRKHLRESVPGQPYGGTAESIEAAIILACERGVLFGGGQGGKAWVRLAEHVNDPQCSRCRRGEC